LNFPFEKVNMPQHLRNGIDDVGQIEIARRYLMKQRCKQEEVMWLMSVTSKSGARRFSNSSAAYKPPKPTTTDNEDTVR
jgi:hypothetical protein